MRSHLFVGVVVLALAGCPENKPPPVTTNGTENCTNHIDDNGDGKIDCLDPKCIDTSACVFGEICDNARDDNNNSLIDCADPQCEGQSCGPSCLCVGGKNTTFDGSKDGGPVDSGVKVVDSGVRDSGVIVVPDAGVCVGCGAGCTCVGGVKTESNCGDQADNDQDLATDCADSDCASASCGTGCQCAGGRKTETVCDDGLDNNGLGGIDCADSDCLGLSCGAGCQCGASVKKELLCSDGLDNDGDGATDCGDSDCLGLSCGAGCQCGASVKKETLCADGLDNDGDRAIDCADSDCVGAGTEICDDGIDNTCDQSVDCGDPKCTGNAKCAGVVNDGLPCRTDNQCAGGLCYSEANTGLPNGACANASNCVVATNVGCHAGTCLQVSGSSKTECRIPCTGNGLGTTGRCRPGFACVDPDEPKNAANNNNFCIALCTKDSECSTIASGYGCNAFSKRCDSKVKTALPDGADCTMGSQCLGGVCLGNLPGNANGYCSAPCRNDLGTCDDVDAGYCNVDSVAGDNVSLCLKRCSFFGECKRSDREGCWKIVGKQTAPVCQCLPATYSFANQPTYGDTCCNGPPFSGTICP